MVPLIARRYITETGKPSMDHKIGVIPFDISGDNIAIMFVTSQRRGRWILPKGNLKSGESHKKRVQA